MYHDVSEYVSPSIPSIELFCGIGGFSAAVPEAEVRLAVDQSLPALAVYRANLPHPTRALNLDHVAAPALDVGAELWWLSPPCQPYTVRGARRGLDDPRARSFRAVVAAIQALRPRWVAMENVPPFAGSAGEALLRAALAGYRVEARVLCPTELGVPMRRRRFYLVAGREPLPVAPAPISPRPLAAYLDDLPPEPLDLEPWRHAIHVVDPGDPAAVANCFTSAYGRSPVRAGSYLRVGAGLRRFHPRELARLLGFPEGWALPPDDAAAWALLGNSLATMAVRHVLAGFARG